MILPLSVVAILRGPRLGAHPLTGRDPEQNRQLSLLFSSSLSLPFSPTRSSATNRLPQIHNPTADIDVDVFPANSKRKRFMSVLPNLVTSLFKSHNREFVQIFSKTYQIFIYIDPTKWAGTSHAEYQIDAWVLPPAAPLSRVHEGAFFRASPAELVAAVSTVRDYILLVVRSRPTDWVGRRSFNSTMSFSGNRPFRS